MPNLADKYKNYAKLALINEPTYFSVKGLTV